jgi:hypothetical protein
MVQNKCKVSNLVKKGKKIKHKDKEREKQKTEKYRRSHLPC